MPLDQRVTFKAPLREKNRVRVPSVMRLQFKLEPAQILKVTISLADTLGVRETFFGAMKKDGHITIPHVTITLLKEDRQTLKNRTMEIILEPA
ncbi:MAG: hypothetical protein ACLQO7_02785 [Candidatus Bathyarchaeia archaeon]|jgi:hypothetical protein